MPYCDRCDRYFGTQHALNQHEENSSAHNICHQCGIDFATWVGLKEHWVQSTRHSYCQRCNDHFDDHEDLFAHYRGSHSFCEPCVRFFTNDTGLHEHNRQSHHYCVECRRVFGSANNLNAHLNSSTHRPRDVRCPFQGCTQSFVSRSAMILHLESGNCRSGANRKVITRLVRQYDTTNIITNPARLITGGAGLSDEITYIATNAAWNGREYECYLCHSGFHSLKALNQHLASPRHQERIYFCPLNTCRQQFSTLSALCQHIESERCGVGRFRPVQTAMDRIVGGMGRLTM